MSIETVSQILREEFAAILQEQNQSWQDGQYSYTLQSDGSIQYTSPESGRRITVTPQSNKSAYDAIMATKPGGAAPAQAQDGSRAPGQTHDPDDLADAVDIASALDKTMAKLKFLIPTVIIAASDMYEQAQEMQTSFSGEGTGSVARDAIAAAGDWLMDVMGMNEGSADISASDFYLISNNFLLPGNLNESMMDAIRDAATNILGLRTRENAEEFMKKKGEQVNTEMDVLDKLIRRYLSKPERARALAGAYYTHQMNDGKEGTNRSIVAELEAIVAVLSVLEGPEYSDANAIIGLTDGLSDKLRDAARFIFDSSSEEIDPQSGTSEKAFQDRSATEAIQKASEWVDSQIERVNDQIKEKQDAFNKKKEEHIEMAKAVDAAAKEAAEDLDKAITVQTGFDSYDEDDIDRAIRNYSKAVRRTGAKEGEVFFKALTGWSKDYTARKLLDYHIEQEIGGDYKSWKDIYKEDKSDLKGSNNIFKDL